MGLFLCARVVLCAAGTHADTQNSLPDRHRAGLPAQEKHHLLRPQVWQYFGVVPGRQGAHQHQALRLRHLAAVVPRGRAGCGGHARVPGPWDPAPHRLRREGDWGQSVGQPWDGTGGLAPPHGSIPLPVLGDGAGFPSVAFLALVSTHQQSLALILSVSGCRWTCSPMGWSCMSCCLGRGLCWDTTSSRSQRNCPKGSVLSWGSPRRCSSTGCRHSWWNVGTLSQKRYKTTLLTWLPSLCRRAELYSWCSTTAPFPVHPSCWSDQEFLLT